MNFGKRPLPLPLACVAIAMLIAGAVEAGSYEIQRLTYSSSGGSTAGGSYQLGSTLGEAGVVSPLDFGGSFLLGLGFWTPDFGGDVSDIDVRSHDSSSDMLMASRPNPFDRSTTIHYTLAEPMPVRLSIYDVTGSRIVTLVEEGKTAGHHLVRWDGRATNGSRVPSGLYFYRIETGSWSQTKKVMKLR